MNSTPSPPLDELVSDPSYGRLKEYLIESTGLAYYANKDADLARRIRRRLSDFGLRDCASYLEQLRDPGRGPAEMDALIAEITIGETYFFRHKEHFDALRDVVLPDLIARSRADQPIRIWCAGCADGAEPYSLAIVLRRDLSYLVAGRSVSILGTDINRQSLANARAGRYEERSLRATPPELRRACFEEKGKQWILAPEYKTGVSFQVHNLVENGCPPPGDLAAFDLIICRNVMIYFGAEVMRKIVARFHDCLTPGGWLLVGPSEPNMTYFTSFRAVNQPGVTLYQRPERTGADSTGLALHPAIAQESIEPALVLPAIASPVPAMAAPTIAAPTINDLRRRADQGDWEGAACCGKELLLSENLNPLVHFHYALVMEQIGDHAEAERSLRRAIYLDRQAALAHYHLGLVLQAGGDLRQAIRCFDNALQALSNQAGDAILPDADGLTVADLSKLARMRVDALRIETTRERL